MADAAPGRAKDDPRGRIPYYRLLLPALLLLIGASGAFVYVFMLDMFFPNARRVTLRLAHAVASVPVPERRGPRRIARVLQPSENVACAEERRFDLWAQAVRWRAFAEAQGMQVVYRGEDAIPRTRSDADLLIVPWILCLDAENAAAIERFARAGGGVVLAGPAAPLAGESVEQAPGGRWLVAAGGAAPGAALAPAQRLELPASPQDQASALGGRALLYWSDWSLVLRTAPDGRARAAATVAAPGAGRVVWFGFPVTHGVGPGAPDLERVRALALLWAAGDAIATLAPWPGGYSHAVAVLVALASGDENEVDLVQALADWGVRPTYLVRPDVLEGAGALRAVLRASPEVAARVDGRTLGGGVTPWELRRRLLAARSALGALADRPVLGLRLPEERVDDVARVASADAGYRYLVGDPLFDRAYPRWLDFAQHPVARLSRAGAGDDYRHLGAEPAAAARGRIAAAPFLRDLARLRALGGLYVLSVDSGRLGSREQRAALRLVLESAQRGGAWIAPAGEIAAFTGARRALRLATDEGGAVTVVNDGEREAEAALALFSQAEPRTTVLGPLAPGSAGPASGPLGAVAIAR